MKIDLKHISVDFNNQTLLRNLSVTFQSSKLSCLLGASGSGKTTILRIIAGVEDSFNGDIFFDDDRVNDVAVGKRKIGWVPQQQLLFPGMNVRGNVSYGLHTQKLSKVEIASRVSEVSDLVGITNLLDRSPEKLSGGERQRVAIARALAPRPKVLLLDEPFSSLDAPERDKLSLIVRDIQMKTGVTTIHVTHSPREADLLADEVFILHNGLIVNQGTMDDLRLNPISYAVASLIGIPNVISNWDDKHNVIIPFDAITFDENGIYEATLLGKLKNSLLIRVRGHFLQMPVVKDTNSIVFRISIDESKFIQLN